MKNKILILLIFSGFISAFAQKPVKLGKLSACHYNGQRLTKEDVYTEAPNTRYREHLNRILLKVGIDPSNVDLRQANIDNAAAAIIDGKPTILYSPQFFDSIEADTRTKWAIYGVLAHEVGHLVEANLFFNETKPEKRVEMEFQADAFSARVLRKMCASRDEAQAGLRIFGKLPPGGQPQKDFYPPVNARINHVGKKWEEEDMRIAKEGNDPCKVIITKLPLNYQNKITRNLTQGVMAIIDDEKVTISYKVYPDRNQRNVFPYIALSKKQPLNFCHFEFDDHAGLPGQPLDKKVVWYYPKDSLKRKDVENADLYSIVSFTKKPLPTPKRTFIIWGGVAVAGAVGLVLGNENRKKKVDLYDDVYAKFRDPDATIYQAPNPSRDEVKKQTDKYLTKYAVYGTLGTIALVGGVTMCIIKRNKKKDYILIASPCGQPGIGLQKRF